MDARFAFAFDRFCTACENFCASSDLMLGRIIAKRFVIAMSNLSSIGFYLRLKLVYNINDPKFRPRVAVLPSLLLLAP